MILLLQPLTNAHLLRQVGGGNYFMANICELILIRLVFDAVAVQFIFAHGVHVGAVSVDDFVIIPILVPL